VEAKCSRAEDVEKVARAFLRYIRENGQNGNWVPGVEAFKAATESEDCRKLEWVRRDIVEKPKRRIAVTRVIERVRKNEFRDIEREKHGPYQQSRVFFRVRV